MLHLLDRPAEHDEFEPERARQRAVIAVEGAGKFAQLREPVALPRRYQPVVEADAQGIVAVGGLKTAHHGDVLPRPAHARDLDARALARCLAFAHQAFDQLEHLRVLRTRLFQHRINRTPLAIEAEVGVPPDQF